MDVPEAGPPGPASGLFDNSTASRFTPWVAAAIVGAILGLVVWAVVWRTPADGLLDQALPVDPELTLARSRAVTIEGSVCGAAGPSAGSGIALADDMVLTAAHVVASADRLEVVRGEDRVPATIVAFDPLKDLAVVEPATPLPSIPEAPDFAALSADDPATVVAAARSGDVSVKVTLATVLETDEVRGTRRSTRDGYLLKAATRPGDSGAGLYDVDGRLVGLLFAVSTNDAERTWATAAGEIESFLADNEPVGAFACDPDRSRVVTAD